MFGQELRSVRLVRVKILYEGVYGQGVKDVSGFAPRPAGHRHTAALIVETLGVVSVAVDHEGHAKLAGAVGMDIFQVKASR